MEIYVLVIFLFFFVLILHSINQFYNRKEGLTDNTTNTDTTSNTLLSPNLRIQADTSDDSNLNIVLMSLQNYLAKRESNYNVNDITSTDTNAQIAPAIAPMLPKPTAAPKVTTVTTAPTVTAAPTETDDVDECVIM